MLAPTFGIMFRSSNLKASMIPLIKQTDIMTRQTDNMTSMIKI